MSASENEVKRALSSVSEDGSEDGDGGKGDGNKQGDGSDDGDGNDDGDADADANVEAAANPCAILKCVGGEGESLFFEGHDMSMGE